MKSLSCKTLLIFTERKENEGREREKRGNNDTHAYTQSMGAIKHLTGTLILTFHVNLNATPGERTML